MVVRMKRRVAARIGGGAAILALALSGGAATAASAAPEPDSVEVQLLAISDFHGRIEFAPAGGAAGAAVLAGAVAQQRAANPATVFVSAGDNIGASTFTSFIADDEPTIDALLAAGLDASNVGNHEFDRGWNDLRGRVLDRYGETGFGLGANVYAKGTRTPVLDEYAIVERGGVRIGFIGTVTEQTATSVTPALVADLDFGSQLEAANRVAARIDDLVDLTVLLAHDGSFSTDCAAIATETSTFGELAREASPRIDAIVSAHTHLSYDCEIAGRPVVQPGAFGSAVGRIAFEIDGASKQLLGADSEVLPLLSSEGEALYPVEPEVERIVADAVAEAEIRGSRPVGAISADILRGGNPPGSDRGVESPLGNLIADITLDAVRGMGASADIGVVNPGSLRADLLYGSDGTVSYRDVASVQPFANTLVTVELSGEQLRQMLEQQWYASGETELKRHLAISEGFEYRYDPSLPRGERVIEMRLLGAPIAPEGRYSVATNAFLASGGDGFSVFTAGANSTDTGRNDLQATVDHFAVAGIVKPPAVGRAILLEDRPTPDPDGGSEGGADGAGADGGSRDPQGGGSADGDPDGEDLGPIAATGSELGGPAGLTASGAVAAMLLGTALFGVAFALRAPRARPEPPVDRLEA